ncbi:MAG: cell division protein ZapA [Gammaproteobacteria bacterium]|nr:cell division protein ZapA [Gammaproteobacteria bacterium]
MSDTTLNLSEVTVSILDKEYRVTCPEKDRAGLEASVNLLNERMEPIRSGGSVVGSERIVVMAALNLAHELLQTKARLARQPVEEQMLERLQEKIQAVLGKLKEHNLEDR